MPIWSRVRAYAAHEDPLVAAGNLIALMVASNQPLYPFYLYWAVGSGVAPALLTFLSTPFFLAVPALARRHPVAGRALLPLAGIANTVLCAKIFGEASGVELFLAPCIMIASMLFRRSERAIMLGLSAIGLLVLIGLHGRYGAPFHLYTTTEYAHFLTLNAFSVGTLTVFVGLTFSNALARIEGSQP